MISLMIVDDEELVIRGIRSILSRENHGYILVGEASNGQEAIEVASKTSPDLIITDICMPEMDGLVMVKKIRDILPETKFVILSGFGEFQYAQEAVRLGVIDYILKPISSNGLYTLLDKVADQIIAGEVKKENEHRSKIEILLGEYIFSKVDDNIEKIIELLEAKEIYQLELLTIKREKCKNCITSEIFEWIRNYIYKGNYGIALSRENGMLLLIKQKKDIQIQFINAAIIRQIRENYGYSIFLDTSGEKDTIGNVREMYQKAMLSYGMRFYDEKEIISRCWDGIDTISIPIGMINNEIVNEILQKIEAKEKEAILGIIKKVINVFKENHIFAKDLTRYFQGTIRMCILNLQLKGYIKSPIQEVLDEKIDYINICHNMKELEQSLEFIIDAIFSLIKNEIEPTTSRIIIEAKRYIMQNYQKDINLTDISASVFISPKYLSDLFKKETGETFLSYLTSVRIDNAKRYLQRFDLKIYEVAESVGYGNPKHFMKVFKKYTEMTPYEYRNNLYK